MRFFTNRCPIPLEEESRIKDAPVVKTSGRLILSLEVVSISYGIEFDLLSFGILNAMKRNETSTQGLIKVRGGRLKDSLKTEPASMTH